MDNNQPTESKSPVFETVKRKGRRPKLEYLIKYQPQVYERILMFIERGAYDYIAAEAFGVTQETFARWLSRGRVAKDGIYRQFFEDVTTAKARARVLAEIQVRAEDPKFFLVNGPGKSQPGRPGWTNVPDHHDSTLSVSTGNPRKEEVSNADLSKTLTVLQELGLVPPISSPENSATDTYVSPSENNQHLLPSPPSESKE